MTGLTEIAYKTRVAILAGAIFIIGIILFQIFIRFFLGAIFILFPPKPPKPNNEFGVLPAIKFPAVSSPSGTLTFTLETIDGTLRDATGTAIVYQMPKNAADLLVMPEAREFAARINLDTNAIQESKQIYRFVDPKYPLRKMRYDIVSNNFILRYAYEQDTGVFSERPVPNENQALSESKNFLTANNLYHEDLKNGTAKVTFLKISGNRLVPATSQSAADAVRVDYFRQPVNGVNTVTPDPAEGQVAFIFSGSKLPQKRLLLVAYTLWAINPQSTAIYQLKPIADAYEQLRSGNGFIASYPTDTMAAVIRKGYLAYYDSFESQPFLQPIYVFEGDNNFVGYVPAITGEWSAQ